MMDKLEAFIAENEKYIYKTLSHDECVKLRNMRYAEGLYFPFEGRSYALTEKHVKAANKIKGGMQIIFKGTGHKDLVTIVSTRYTHFQLRPLWDEAVKVLGEPIEIQQWGQTGFLIQFDKVGTYNVDTDRDLDLFPVLVLSGNGLRRSIQFRWFGKILQCANEFPYLEKISTLNIKDTFRHTAKTVEGFNPAVEVAAWIKNADNIVAQTKYLAEQHITNWATTFTGAHINNPTPQLSRLLFYSMSATTNDVFNAMRSNPDVRNPESTFDCLNNVTWLTKEKYPSLTTQAIQESKQKAVKVAYAQAKPTLLDRAQLLVRMISLGLKSLSLELNLDTILNKKWN